MDTTSGRKGSIKGSVPCWESNLCSFLTIQEDSRSNDQQFLKVCDLLSLPVDRLHIQTSYLFGRPSRKLAVFSMLLTLQWHGSRGSELGFSYTTCPSIASCKARLVDYHKQAADLKDVHIHYKDQGVLCLIIAKGQKASLLGGKWHKSLGIKVRRAHRRTLKILPLENPVMP